METIYRDDFNSLEPKAALILFTDQDNSRYLELRKIDKDGAMGEARPVSRAFIQNMLEGFSKTHRSTPSGAIPPNLLYCDSRAGKGVYMWYNPPMKRNRFFNARIGLEDGKYHVPGTLYLVQGGTLSVFCFAGKKPAMDKPLLGVPYFNVYSDGRVCMGSARPQIPDKETISYSDIMLAWENAFWNSIDVHTNGSLSTKENLVETIREYKDKPFATSALCKHRDSFTPSYLIRNTIVK